MKAIVYSRYGGPEVLRLQEVEKPRPKENEILVQVFAASLNASDWENLTGRPLYTRLWGLFRPRHRILGSDIAGRVEAVGCKVQQFQPGDEVFGDILYYWGGFAEYVCAPATTLVRKPAELSFEEAAALPQAALIAWQGLRQNGAIRPGQRVLINGAGGGAGSFAVQMAKAFGAEVTGVDSAAKLAMIRSLGADHVIDYTREDFTARGEQYDLILDLVASHSIFSYKRTLAPGGAYLMVGGSLAHLFQTLVLGSLLSLTRRRKMALLAHQPNKDLATIIELLRSGKVVPAIDRCESLRQVPEALHHLGAGHHKGKIVVTIKRS